MQKKANVPQKVTDTALGSPRNLRNVLMETCFYVTPLLHMKAMGGCWCDVRPHPGPLPREREKRSPRVGDADGLGLRMTVLRTSQEAQTA